MLRKIHIGLLTCAVFYFEISNVGATFRNGLTEKIGNFSLEMLYHTAATEPEDKNLIISPIIVWATLAAVSEGATGKTKYEINNAVRLPTNKQDNTRQSFCDIAARLNIYTSTVEIEKINAIILDEQKLPSEDYSQIAERYYEVDLITTNFADNDSANDVNRVVSDITNGKIENIADKTSFQDASVVLTSAVYFKGQWAVPFNVKNTRKQPFYDNYGKETGEVNMMISTHSYPVSNVNALQASVIEIPYGKENRLSMIIMLPNLGVSLQTMFKNFAAITLDSFFEELKASKEHRDSEVELSLPRFKIESTVDLANVLINRMGINDLFDIDNVRLPYMARKPVYVSKATHKAEIEVTEEGTGNTKAEIRNSFRTRRFEVDRPFTFMVIKKLTNSIVFGGFYKQPSLY